MYLSARPAEEDRIEKVINAQWTRVNQRWVGVSRWRNRRCEEKRGALRSLRVTTKRHEDAKIRER